jgi:hypothetical protein
MFNSNSPDFSAIYISTIFTFELYKTATSQHSSQSIQTLHHTASTYITPNPCLSPNQVKRYMAWPFRIQIRQPNNMTSLLIDSFGSAQGLDTTNQQLFCCSKHCWVDDRSLYRIVVALSYVTTGGKMQGEVGCDRANQLGASGESGG